MKILICPDKFKESLSASDVALHIRNGLRQVLSDAHFVLLPLADGGEGTAETLAFATGGRMEQMMVHDPLMRMINAKYGISGDGKTAFIEMAAASGLTLLASHERNPLKTSSYGTGELIRHALDRNCGKIIVGIGGSATVDGGVGMAQAIGISFRDQSGREVQPGGGNLKQIKSIDDSARDHRIGKCVIEVACDVTNVLWGPEGAAYVYGPQKGANKEEVEILDNGLKHLARVIKHELNRDVDTLEGGGAAGGLGSGLAVFAEGRLMKGFELVADYVGLERKIMEADLVITGEGKMDGQTLLGKTPAGVARLAGKYQKPVIAFTGWIENESALMRSGFTTVIPIADKPLNLTDSLRNAPELLEKAVERSFRLFMTGFQTGMNS